MIGAALVGMLGFQGFAVALGIASFVLEGDTEVTYWIRRDRWGRGIATAALAELLRQVTVRPLFARIAADNAGSARVLLRNGFRSDGGPTFRIDRP